VVSLWVKGVCCLSSPLKLLKILIFETHNKAIWLWVRSTNQNYSLWQK
jgi:hypothetical protein